MDRPLTQLDDPAGLDTAWYLDHVVLAQGQGESAQHLAWRLRADELRRTDIGGLASRQGFVVSRRQALDRGFTPTDVRRLTRSGAWHSPGRGALAPFRRPDAVTARVLAATAVVLTRRELLISHRSAALAQDLPVINLAGRPFIAAELTALTSGQRRLGSAHIRSAMLAPEHRSTWFGAPITSVARTVVDLARLDRGQGLVAADAALRRGVVSRATLVAVAADLAGRSGAAQARDLVGLADPLSESPLESLTRLGLLERGVPRPELQVWITDPSDGWRARVDMCWRRQRVILEADGRGKYTGDELWKEKVRQDRLERLDYRVIRVRWQDVVGSPDHVAARVLRSLGR